ncbi:MAG: hypothetical protein M0C28_08295 [Candidatus Moduliflexus flocculans]|nr:hypothetical protein [Candidatus Moduliflexus flocculans]
MEIAKRLEQAGVDAIDVSSANYETMNYWLEPISFETGMAQESGQGRQGQCQDPGPGRQCDPQRLNRLKPSSEKDTRISSVWDVRTWPIAAWSRKVSEGCEQDIKRCISCLWCFESFLANAAAGRAARMRRQPAPRP